MIKILFGSSDWSISAPLRFELTGVVEIVFGSGIRELSLASGGVLLIVVCIWGFMCVFLDFH